MESKRPFSFNVEELQELILQPCSSVRSKRSIRHIALHPSNLGDLKAAIKKILNQLLNKFDSNFGGFLLGYKNVIVTTSKGVVVNDDYSVHFDIEADFYIFTPEVGCILNGMVNKKSRDHIGCLVNKFFNVSILRPNKESSEEWLGESVGIGDRVTFSVKLCDFTGNLPYLQGTLMSSSPAAKENTEDQSPKKKKHKKDSSIENSQDEILVVPEVEESNKRKRDSDDDVDGTRKKKKNRRKREEAEEDNTEQFNSLHMSSEDPEYGQVIQHIKTAYLNENVEEETPKKEKDKKKHKKRKLHTTLNESVEITNEVDAAEQVESKKKKQTEKHESEETTSIVPKYNQLWENFKGRSKKLEESLASWNNSSLGFEQLRQSLQNQKDTVLKEDVTGNEEIVTKHKNKKDKHNTSDSPKKQKKSTTFTESSLGVSSLNTPDKIGQEDWNLHSQLSDETQTSGSSKLKSSNSVSPKKHKKKHKETTIESDPDVSSLKMPEKIEEDSRNLHSQLSDSPSKHEASNLFSPKKHKKKDKEATVELISSLEMPDNNLQDNSPNLHSQLSGETQTGSLSKLKTSNSISPKKHKKKQKDTTIESDSHVSLKSADDISLENVIDSADKQETSSPDKQNVLSQFSLDDDFPMITQNVVVKSSKNKQNSKLLDPSTRIAAVYSDSDNDREEDGKLSSLNKVRISENSTFYKLAGSMANSADRKRPKLGKGNTMLERRSLPLLKPRSFEAMDPFDQLLSPLTPASTSSGEKKKKSVNFDDRDYYFTPESVSSSKSKSKQSPGNLSSPNSNSKISPKLLETALEHEATLQTPSAKKSKKQKQSPKEKLVTNSVISPEEPNINKNQTSSKDKLELDNANMTNDKDISSSGTEISLNSFVLPDLNGILKVLGSPSSETKTTTSKEASTSETKSSISSEISRILSSPSKEGEKKTVDNSEKVKSKDSGKDKKKKKGLSPKTKTSSSEQAAGNSTSELKSPDFNEILKTLSSPSVKNKTTDGAEKLKTNKKNEDNSEKVKSKDSGKDKKKKKDSSPKTKTESSEQAEGKSTSELKSPDFNEILKALSSPSEKNKTTDGAEKLKTNKKNEDNSEKVKSKDSGKDKKKKKGSSPKTKTESSEQAEGKSTSELKSPDFNKMLKALSSLSEKDDKTTDGAEKLKTNKKNEDSKKDKKKKDKKHKKKHGDEKIKKKKERKGNNKNKKDELSDLKKLSDSLLQKFLSKQ